MRLHFLPEDDPLTFHSLCQCLMSFFHAHDLYATYLHWTGMTFLKKLAIASETQFSRNLGEFMISLQNLQWMLGVAKIRYVHLPSQCFGRRFCMIRSYWEMRATSENAFKQELITKAVINQFYSSSSFLIDHQPKLISRNGKKNGYCLSNVVLYHQRNATTLH